MDWITGVKADGTEGSAMAERRDWPARLKLAKLVWKAEATVAREPVNSRMMRLGWMAARVRPWAVAQDVIAERSDGVGP